MPKHETTQVELLFFLEKEKAIGFKTRDDREAPIIFLPKSQIEIHPDKSSYRRLEPVTVELPKWLAEKTNLI